MITEMTTELICINNDQYPASLTVGQTYIKVFDEKAESLGLVRVIDDSNESYLYSPSHFTSK